MRRTRRCELEGIRLASRRAARCFRAGSAPSQLRWAPPPHPIGRPATARSSPARVPAATPPPPRRQRLVAALTMRLDPPARPPGDGPRRCGPPPPAYAPRSPAGSPTAAAPPALGCGSATGSTRTTPVLDQLAPDHRLRLDPATRARPCAGIRDDFNSHARARAGRAWGCAARRAAASDREFHEQELWRIAQRHPFVWPLRPARPPNALTLLRLLHRHRALLLTNLA